MEKNRLSLLIDIPEDWGNTKLMEQPQLLLYTRQKQPAADFIISKLNRIILRIIGSLKIAQQSAFPAKIDDVFKKVMLRWDNYKLPVQCIPYQKTTEDEIIPDGFNQSSPGMLIQFVIMGIMFTALAFINERTDGTLNRLMLTPHHKIQIILGKLLGFLLIVMIQQYILIILGQLAFQVHYFRNPVSLFVLIFSFSVFISILGLLISASVKKKEQAVIITFILMIFLSAFGGAWFLLNILGTSFTTVAKFFPSYWAMQGFQDIILKGIRVKVNYVTCSCYTGIFSIIYSHFDVAAEKDLNMPEEIKKILFVIAPSSDLVKMSNIIRDLPNIGVMYLSAIVNQSDIATIIINKFNTNDRIFSLTKEILGHKPDIIGFTLYDSNFENTHGLIKALRYTYKGSIIIGGYTATVHAENILKSWPGVRYVLTRESEESLPQFLKFMEGKLDITKVENLVYRDSNGMIQYNQTSPPVNLNNLPWPERVWGKKWEIQPLLTSRGCQSRCCFCSSSSFISPDGMAGVRRRKVIDVVDEIEYCYEHGSRIFCFYDDDLSIKSKTAQKWVEQFCSEIQKRNIDIAFYLEMRIIDILHNRNILNLLIETGLKFISLGMESFTRLTSDHLVIHIGSIQNGKKKQPLKSDNYKIIKQLTPHHFEKYLFSVDLFISRNVTSTTMARAVLAGIPTLLIKNSYYYNMNKNKTNIICPNVLDTVKGIEYIYPFYMFPVGWYNFLKPVLKQNMFKIMK